MNNTKRNLNSGLFEQTTGDTMNLSGNTEIYGNLTINQNGNIDSYSGYKLSGETLNIQQFTGSSSANLVENFNTFTGDTETNLNSLRVFGGNGIVSGFGISIYPPTSASTTINIGSGVGYIYNNYNDPNNPQFTKIEYSGATNVNLTYLNTNLVTYLAIDVNHNIIQQTSPYTFDQRRQYILIGAAIHTDKTIVNAVNNLPDVILDSHNQFNDLLDSLKNFNYSGNVIGANGANLSINKSAGKMFKRGVNFNIDNKNPHLITLAGLIAPSNIRYRLSDSTEYSNTNVIDPNYYENPLTVRTIVDNNKFTVQRIFIFPSNLIRIQYGQTMYASMADAELSFNSAPYTTEANLAENGLLRGYLIIQKGCTDLTNTTQAKFIAADKFGESSLGGSSSAYWGLIAGTLSNQTDLQAELDAKTDKLKSIIHTTTGYTLTSNDNNKIIECDGTFTVILPDSLSTGFNVKIVNVGSGTITLAATTLQSIGNLLITQYTEANVYHRGGNIWLATGSLST